MLKLRGIRYIARKPRPTWRACSPGRFLTVHTPVKLVSYRTRPTAAARAPAHTSFLSSVNLIQMGPRGPCWFTSSCFRFILSRVVPRLPCGPELARQLAPWIPEWDAPPLICPHLQLSGRFCKHAPPGLIVTAAWASSAGGSLSSPLPLREGVKCVTQDDSEHGPSGHQHAGVLPDCGFPSVRRSHLSCRVLHVTPLGSASTCAQTLASLLLSSAEGPHSPPLPTLALLFFSFPTVESLRNRCLQSLVLGWSCCSQAFCPCIPPNRP